MLLQDTRRESEVASEKARTWAPVGKEDLGIYEGRAMRAREVPFLHRHTQSTNGTQQVLGSREGFTAEVTLEVSPKGYEEPCRWRTEQRPSRPIATEENTTFWNSGDSAQESVPAGCHLVGG